MTKHDQHEKSVASGRASQRKLAVATRKRVLLVDDDVDFLEIQRMTLEAAGYEVAVAHDAKEALRVATKGKFDLAILDVIMATPSDGFELARALRNDARTSKVPLIMLTSINAVNEAKGTLFRLGDQDRDELWLPVDKFVDKPISSETLLRFVKELCA